MNDYLSHGTSPLVTPSPRSLREKLSCQLFSHATLCILLDVAGRSQNTLSTFTQAYHDQPYYAAKRNTCLLLPNDGIPILLRRNNCPMLAGLLMLKPSWPPTLKTPTTIGCSAAANVCFGTCGVRRIPTERFQFPFKGRFFGGQMLHIYAGVLISTNPIWWRIPRAFDRILPYIIVLIVRPSLTMPKPQPIKMNWEPGLGPPISDQVIPSISIMFCLTCRGYVW